MENPKKKAQTQVDKAMAEVVRLNEVAEAIQEANEKAKANYDKTSEDLQADITNLTFDKTTAEEAVSKIKEKVTEAQEELTEITKGNKELKEEAFVLQAEVDKKEKLASAFDEASINSISRFDRLMSEKQLELESVVKAIEDKKNEALVEEKQIQASIEKAKRSLSAQKDLCEASKILTDIQNEDTKKKETLAANAEHRQAQAEDLVEKAKVILVDTQKQIETQKEDLASKTAEVKEVAEELKSITIERLNSKSFIEELRNKETNLKKRYEDVGMEYKT